MFPLNQAFQILVYFFEYMYRHYRIHERSRGLTTLLLMEI